ncbi:MAG: proline dehydrogenase family protein [Gemmatimonadota bacterium]
MRTALLWGSRNQWLGKSLPRLQFTRRAVQRFMPGESLEEALSAAHELAAGAMGATLTQLGENVTSEEEAAAVERHYVTVFDRLSATALDAEVSIKPTQLGMDVRPGLAEAAALRLARRSAAAGKVLWIDMEGSEYTDATIALYRELREDTPWVGLCLQANMRRTPADLEALLPLRPHIRLVKGAYLEPHDVAFARKAEVDGAYAVLATRLLEHLVATGAEQRLAIATHDLQLARRIRDAAAERRVIDTCEFQMLYGIAPDAQRRLARSGLRVRVLISYGEAWFAWYMRRLAERPANVAFMLRSMVS